MLAQRSKNTVVDEIPALSFVHIRKDNKLSEWAINWLEHTTVATSYQLVFAWSYSCSAQHLLIQPLNFQSEPMRRLTGEFVDPMAFVKSLMREFSVLLVRHELEGKVRTVSEPPEIVLVNPPWRPATE